MTNSSVAPPIPSQPPELGTANTRPGRPRGAYDLSLHELASHVTELGLPAYRARQIWGWAYRQCVTDYPEMANIPAALRDTLAAQAPLSLLEPVRAVAAGNGQTDQDAIPDRRPKPARNRTDALPEPRYPLRLVPGWLRRRLRVLRNRSDGAITKPRRRGNGCPGSGRGPRSPTARPGTDEHRDDGDGRAAQNYAEVMKFINIIHDPDGLDIGARLITVST